jgi:long-subunit acyl-CoA synthetase (AMP-forming)
MKYWSLFLDDIRFPEDVRYDYGPYENLRICRSMDDAVWAVKQYGLPTMISFDHDLADTHYIIGDGEKMPAAFIQPAFDFVKEWAIRHSIDLGNSNEDLCNNPKVIARIQEDIDEANKKFGNWEQVKRFELTPDLWSIDAGHLTPTMKLKRKIIKEKYQTLYDKIYNS